MRKKNINKEEILSDKTIFDLLLPCGRVVYIHTFIYVHQEQLTFINNIQLLIYIKYDGIINIFDLIMH